LQKLDALDATLGDPWDTLAMATIDGAACLGMDDVTGSLEPGKRADLVVVDLQRAHFTPLLRGARSNLAAHLVFSACRTDVRDVWVDGQQVVQTGRLITADLEAIRAEAQSAAEELFDRRDRLPPRGRAATMTAEEARS
jgi:5-methylthioadenosine/S-adenosylhomocysteine deaminase